MVSFMTCDMCHVPCCDAPNSDGGCAIVDEVEVC
jgi:hypothetical protein